MMARTIIHLLPIAAAALCGYLVSSFIAPAPEGTALEREYLQKITHLEEQLKQSSIERTRLTEVDKKLSLQETDLGIKADELRTLARAASARTEALQKELERMPEVTQ